jgi:hypothetical protein
MPYRYKEGSWDVGDALNDGGQWISDRWAGKSNDQIRADQAAANAEGVLSGGSGGGGSAPGIAIAQYPKYDENSWDKSGDAAGMAKGMFEGAMQSAADDTAVQQGADRGRTANIGTSQGQEFLLDAKRKGLIQDADIETHALEQRANRNAQFQNNMAQGNAAFAGGLMNKMRNADTGRTQALNAQANTAKNVSDQLNALSQARSTNANLVAQTLNGSMFK